MTNLEWVVEHADEFGIGLCDLAYVATHGSYCGLVCKDCEFRSDDEAVKVLREEHEEKKR